MSQTKLHMPNQKELYFIHIPYRYMEYVVVFYCIFIYCLFVVISNLLIKLKVNFQSSIKYHEDRVYKFKADGEKRTGRMGGTHLGRLPQEGVVCMSQG